MAPSRAHLQAVGDGLRLVEVCQEFVGGLARVHVRDAVGADGLRRDYECGGVEGLGGDGDARGHAAAGDRHHDGVEHFACVERSWVCC